MKRTNFKITGAICLFALLLSLTSVMGTKRFSTARYKITGQPSCFQPDTMPDNCTTLNTGVLCTSTSGSVTKTFYQGACVTPYYMIQ